MVDSGKTAEQARKDRLAKIANDCAPASFGDHA
jgi:hypothetical protein